MDDSTRLISQNLKNIREEKRISLDKLAELTGVSNRRVGLSRLTHQVDRRVPVLVVRLLDQRDRPHALPPGLFADRQLRPVGPDPAAGARRRAR